MGMEINIQWLEIETADYSPLLIIGIYFQSQRTSLGFSDLAQSNINYSLPFRKKFSLSILHFNFIITIHASSPYLCLRCMLSPPHTPPQTLFIPSILLGSLWDLYLEGRKRNNLKGY